MTTDPRIWRYDSNDGIIGCCELTKITWHTFYWYNAPGCSAIGRLGCASSGVVWSIHRVQLTCDAIVKNDKFHRGGMTWWNERGRTDMIERRLNSWLFACAPIYIRALTDRRKFVLFSNDIHHRATGTLSCVLNFNHEVTIVWKYDTMIYY